VLIVPGAKNKCPFYDRLKRLLLEKLPVPSQVVLSQTIARGKNLHSIVNKIMIQICSKIGGLPWVVKEMPFNDMKTMVCGYDVHHQRRQESLLSFVATLNPTYTKYFANCVRQKEGEEIATEIVTIFKGALERYKRHNGAYPERIVIYRDGVGES